MQQLSIERKQYLAGFFDGDGSIDLTRLEVPQSYDAGIPPELSLVYNLFGGNISISREKKGDMRTQWRLRITQPTGKLREVLELVRDHGILKRESAIHALDYMDGHGDDRDTSRSLVRETHDNYASVTIDTNRITMAYVSGLFAADGSIFMKKSKETFDLRASITKKLCIPLLHAIRKFLDAGFVCESVGYLSFSRGQVKRLLPLLKEHLWSSQKIPQIELVERFQKGMEKYSQIPRKRSRDELKFIEEIAMELKKIKKL